MLQLTAVFYFYTFIVLAMGHGLYRVRGCAASTSTDSSMFGSCIYDKFIQYYEPALGATKFITTVEWMPMSCLCSYHRVIMLNRGSMLAFQWRKFSPPLSSAHKLLKNTKEVDRRRCNSRGTQNTYFSLSSPTSPPPPQLARSLEWRHALTLHILVGKICITFFHYESVVCIIGRASKSMDLFRNTLLIFNLRKICFGGTKKCTPF